MTQIFDESGAIVPITVIDTTTNKVAKWIALPGLAYGTAATPDGRWLLVTVPQKNQVAVVDLKTLQVARSIAVPDLPQEVLVRPDAKVAYVSCIAGARTELGKVAAIDLAQWKVEKVIVAGKYADGLAWAK